jgi:hypothetical protein
MQKTLTIVRYLIAIVIVLTLAGLLAWYLFLKSHTDTTVQIDDARGIDSAAPSFTGSTGSTYKNIAQTTVDDTGNKSAEATSAPPTLWRVSQTPTAGMGFVQDSSGLKLNFVERASGNVFSADLATGKVERLTNTLLPKTYVAAFTNDGAVTLRSTDDIGKTTLFAGIVPPKKAPVTAEIATSAPVALKGAYLAQNITDLAVNPKAHEMFYILPDPKVGVIGIRSAWDGTGQKRVFESGIIGWRPTWLSDGKIILTQYPAYDIAGSAYTLESTGILTPIIRNIPGLTILPQTSSKTYIYGTGTNGTLTLYVQKDKKDAELLPVKTVADKCVWNPKDNTMAYCAVPNSLGSGDFIDNWLQGRIHTSDTWWEVNTKDDTAQIIFVSDNPYENSIDVIQPTIDQTGSYISFMNGVDLSLWALRIPSDTSKTTNTTQ